MTRSNRIAPAERAGHSKARSLQLTPIQIANGSAIHRLKQ